MFPSNSCWVPPHRWLTSSSLADFCFIYHTWWALPIRPYRPCGWSQVGHRGCRHIIVTGLTIFFLFERLERCWRLQKQNLIQDIKGRVSIQNSRTCFFFSNLITIRPESSNVPTSIQSRRPSCFVIIIHKLISGKVDMILCVAAFRWLPITQT